MSLKCSLLSLLSFTFLWSSILANELTATDFVEQFRCNSGRSFVDTGSGWKVIEPNGKERPLTFIGRSPEFVELDDFKLRTRVRIFRDHAVCASYGGPWSPWPGSNGSWKKGPAVAEVSNGDQYHRLLKNFKGRSLVIFYSDKCGWCKKQQAVIEEAIHQLPEDLQILRVNVRHLSKIADQSKIKGLPTLDIYHGLDGQRRNSGFLDSEKLLRFVR